MKHYKTCDKCNNGYWEDVTCDICGKTCILTLHQPAIGLKDLSMINKMDMGAFWVMGSKKTPNGATWECDVCEECAYKIKDYIEKELGGHIRITERRLL